MSEVCVIARFVARTGTEDQLKALLEGMLAPTHAEPGCKLYDLYESDTKGRFFFSERWKARLRSIYMWPRRTLSA
jgi:quinol monooxygenase YgiN